MNTKIEILKEKTFFEIPVRIEDGVELRFSEDDVVIDENNIPVPNDKYVVLSFNEKRIEMIPKILNRLITSRGIKEVSDVGYKDYDVDNLKKEYIRKYKLTPEYKNTKTVPVEKIKYFQEKALREIISIHSDHYQKAQLEVIMYIILYKDLFYTENGHLGCKVDLPFRNEYFIDDNESLDELDSFLLETQMSKEFKPVIDKTSPIEISISYLYQLLEDYQEFQNTFAKYLNISAVYYSNSKMKEEEDLETFRTRLENLLSEQIS